MQTDLWLNETLYDEWGQRFRVSRELARQRSEFQEIIVFESQSHGRVLVMDSVIQLTERDEFVYHEMLAHVPLLAHGDARSVLIIGGGDGGVLRRVLQHRSVERAVLVEIDGTVVRLATEHLPGVGGDAWTDLRAEIVIGDGIAHVRDAKEAAYDVIIVDGTDPVGAGEVLFTEEFYGHAARALSAGGVLVTQCGVPHMQGEELAQTYRRCAARFPHVTAYVAAVPTYIGGFMAMGFAAKRPGLSAVPAEELRRRAKAAGILGTTGYWTPDLHAAAFHLPPYITALWQSSEASAVAR